ncbi:MAG: hypothetical protein M3R27_03045, partial [Bacteroidota bacterium]|nr:hypothetical protein [Bacteroidota bacterium]
SSFGENNFRDSVLPLVKKIAAARNVFWSSGSLGSGKASLFYDKDQESNVVFIQSAIRDLPHDAVLQVIIKNGNVSFKSISLTGNEVQPLQNYGVEYWSKGLAPEEKFNFRLLPYLTMKLVSHSFFWIGMLTASMLALFLFLIWKRKRKRN